MAVAMEMLKQNPRGNGTKSRLHARIWAMESFSNVKGISNLAHTTRNERLTLTAIEVLGRIATREETSLEIVGNVRLKRAALREMKRLTTAIRNPENIKRAKKDCEIVGSIIDGVERTRLFLSGNQMPQVESLMA